MYVSFSSTDTTRKSGGRHILVFPYPAQGHMIPLLDLTHHLILRGLTVTILVTPRNLPLIQPLLSSHPSAATPLVLPFPKSESVPPGVENNKDIPPHYFRPLMSALRGLRRPIVDWFRTHPSPPVAILSDMFFGWTSSLAAELGIKRLVFSPSGALAISVLNALWIHMPNPNPNPINNIHNNNNNNVDEDAVVTLETLPGQPKFAWRELSSLYRSYVSGHPHSGHLREDFLENMDSWGFVFNTFADLEQVYLTHMATELGHSKRVVWAVGPLDRIGHDIELGLGSAGRGASGPVEDAGEIMSWLDKCHAEGEMVVYICFGSQAVLTNDQMEAIAAALEKSTVRFVWSVKEPPTTTSRSPVQQEQEQENEQEHEHEQEQEQGQGRSLDGDTKYFSKLPDGFVDRVAGRGLVIRGWAPQVLILRHKAVVSFLTHCGWNSVLEALSSGTTMLTWPMTADQFCNAVLLVNHLKVAVRVCEGTTTVPDPDQLAKWLADSVGHGGAEVRARATDLSNKAFEAVKQGGTSYNDLDKLVNQIQALPSALPAPLNISDSLISAFKNII